MRRLGGETIRFRANVRIACMLMRPCSLTALLLLSLTIIVGASAHAQIDFADGWGGVSKSLASPTMKGAPCYMAHYMKIGFAVGNGGACEALQNADEGPRLASSVCGSRAPSAGPSKKGEYSMDHHQPQGGKGSPIKFNDNKTDCSGQVCAVWLAAGFAPAVEGKFDSACPTAAQLAKLKHRCLEEAADEMWQVGDVVCCRANGAQNSEATGHCINIADQVGDARPTNLPDKLVVANASGKDAGWTLQGGSKALGSSKMRGAHCTILRPKDDRTCFDRKPPGFEGQDQLTDGKCEQVMKNVSPP